MFKPSFDPLTGNLEIPCSTCGKPLTHVNERGMFCEDKCEDTVSDEEMEELKNFVKKLIPSDLI